MLVGRRGLVELAVDLQNACQGEGCGILVRPRLSSALRGVGDERFEAAVAISKQLR